MKAWDEQHAIFVPGVCILEWGNHVARIGDPAARDEAARLLANEVREALNPTQKQRKFTLVGVPDLPGLAALVEHWSAGEVDRLGLVDSAIAEHARNFKKAALTQTQVHIWTGDAALKRAEPDSEAAPWILLS